MRIRALSGEDVELEELETRIDEQPSGKAGGPAMRALRVQGDDQESARMSTVVDRAARAFFDFGTKEPSEQRSPAVFRERRSGLLRMAHSEIVIRFEPGTSDVLQRKILKDYGLEIRARHPLIPEQFVVFDPSRQLRGRELVSPSYELPRHS